MRFEIKTGGAFVIVIGLAALSGAVFALGLMAGYEIASQSPASPTQVATEYPMPSPMAMPSPAAPVAAQASTPAAVPVAPALASKATPMPTAAPRLAAVVPAAHIARHAPGEETVSVSKTVEKPRRTLAELTEHPLARPVAAPPRRHGYHIEIEAAMDSRGAQQMAGRLRTLGYTPEIVTTQISGQTWYMVRVGPYPTPAAAQAAQVELRQKYAARFAH